MMSRQRNQENNSLYINFKKYLGINLTREMRKLNNEN
jgi:hypothetical protein